MCVGGMGVFVCGFAWGHRCVCVGGCAWVCEEGIGVCMCCGWVLCIGMCGGNG